MTTVMELLRAVDDLCACAEQVIEDSFRLTVAGSSLDERVRQHILRVVNAVDQMGLDAPSLLVSNESVNIADLSVSDYDGEAWRLILGTGSLAKLMSARGDETTLLFFSVSGFHQWLAQIDPFSFPHGNFPDLNKPTTIRVHGLADGFGGPSLWVLPPEMPPHQLEAVNNLPDLPTVQGLIHVNSIKPLRLCPRAYALTWGNIDSPEAFPLVYISASVLGACLVQELKLIDDRYEVTLRGTKRLSLPLFDEVKTVAPDTLKNLIDTVQWIYDERPETRLSLVMDRLSIDIEEGQSLLSGVDKYLKAALQQARDSYSFVILERKDAYHKEVRELMKDMKSQADLYAAKVRDLVNSLTRDVLGILVFFSFSFIGRFDQSHLETLLKSPELALLTKALASYLVLSFVLQLMSHLRDVSLAYEESKTWLDVLQYYSSQADKQDRFLGPLQKRRTMLFMAMILIGFIYVALAVVIWFLPSLILLLLG